MRRELLRALREPNLTERVLLIAAVMQKLSAENWQGMLEAFAEEKNLYGRQHGDVRLLLAQRAGEVVGLDALKYFLRSEDGEATRAALTGWAIKNPVAALEWLGKEASPETRRQFIGAAIRGLALTEPDLAISELESIPIERRKNYTSRFVDSLVRSTGLDGTEALLGGMIKRATATNTLKDDYLANIFWDFAQLKIEQAYTTGDILGLANWLQAYVGQPYVNAAIVGAVVNRYARTDPLKAFQWLESYNRQNMAAGQANTVGYDFLMNAWTQKEGTEAVGRWLSQMTAHPHYDRIAQRYSGVVAAKDPASAMRWAATIKDPAIKSAAVNYIQDLNKPKG
ncbi:MAG: hypothetical protein Q7S40_30395 [Opitutaceae bacterium]|nr:hypothetical protein [Opitutaceae bacterium]